MACSAHCEEGESMRWNKTHSRNSFDHLFSPSAPPHTETHFLPYSSVSGFSPVSGWRQAGPLRAFKRLLKVCGRRGPYPSAATHNLGWACPQNPPSSHLVSWHYAAPPLFQAKEPAEKKNGSARRSDLSRDFEDFNVMGWVWNDAGDCLETSMTSSNVNL